MGGLGPRPPEPPLNPALMGFELFEWTDRRNRIISHPSSGAK